MKETQEKHERNSWGRSRTDLDESFTITLFSPRHSIRHTTLLLKNIIQYLYFK